MADQDSLEYISSNLISLAEVADISGLSANHLRRMSY